MQFFLDCLGAERVSNIKMEEIADLILDTPNYPFIKVFSDKGFQYMS